MKKKDFISLLIENAEKISQKSGSSHEQYLCAYIGESGRLTISQIQRGQTLQGKDVREMSFGTDRMSPEQVREWIAEYYND